MIETMGRYRIKEILFNGNKYYIALLFLLFFQGCSYDKIAYKYGNGIKDGIEGGSYALACVAVAPMVCAGVSTVRSYINGKQEAREKLVAKDNAELIKKLADAKAKDMGVKVDTCWFWNC